MLKPREAITALAPYESPISARAALNLDLNENLAGCAPQVLARLRRLTVEDLSRYPQRELGEQRVAGFLGVSPEQVLLTNGADETLTFLFAAYLADGYELLFADPTFVMYPMLGQAFGAKLVRVPPNADLTLPTAEILAHISPRTRVIAIANPNNPTGTVAPTRDLLQIVKAAPDAAVLIDEAYFDFHGETLLPELRNHSNLFVARTFSKVYGLAGLRIGVLIGPTQQIGYIRRFCPPFNVNAVALACLDAAIADQEFVRGYMSQIRHGREQVEWVCKEFNLHYWPSETNFILVRIGSDVTRFTRAMQRHGVMVRDSSAQPGCQGCVRITIPVGNQVDILRAAMRDSIKEMRR